MDWESWKEREESIRILLATAKAAAWAASAASSAAQDASFAAAAAAENAKAALEEVEKLVNILEGGKCHQQMPIQKSINRSTSFVGKTLNKDNDDETKLALPRNVINCDQGAKISVDKDTVGVKEKMSKFFKQIFSRTETVVDGIKDCGPPSQKTTSLGQNQKSDDISPPVLPEAESTFEEDWTILKSIDNADPCQRIYSRDILLSFQTHPLALESPQSKDPLVLPWVNRTVLQMRRELPKEFPQSEQGWAQECSEQPRTQECPVTGMIKEFKSRSVGIPKEPQQNCSVIGFIALKHEYEQMLPSLQPFLPPSVLDSYKEALALLETVLSPRVLLSTQFENTNRGSSSTSNHSKDHNRVNVLLHDIYHKMMTTLIDVLKAMPSNSPLREQIRLLVKGHFHLTYDTSKAWIAVKDCTMKNILLCCSNIMIQNEGISTPCKEMRTLRIMKATNNIKFQVENVRLDEEETLTFQLVDGEGEDKAFI